MSVAVKEESSPASELTTLTAAQHRLLQRHRTRVAQQKCVGMTHYISDA